MMPKFLYLGFSWLEWDKASFSRAQFGTHLGYFRRIWGIFRWNLNLQKRLSDAGLEVVPGGGIEPSTHGFSGITPEFHNFFKLIKFLKQLGFSVAGFI
jgi:hypothetical protein